MRQCVDLTLGVLKNKLDYSKRKQLGMEAYCKSLSSYGSKRLLTAGELNKYVYDKIVSGNPFMMSRFGATELFCSSIFEFDINSKKKKAMDQLRLWSGFFPDDVSLGDRFNQCIIESCKEIDILGIWGLRFEEYYIKNYTSYDMQSAFLLDLEPWRYPQKSWSSALAGKKVLIIHPFEHTIRKQYERRELLFPNTDILPEFELKTLKAVQTCAGQNDDRFNNWFNALEYSYQEAMKINFDIAILGCGAYGMPLAAKLKSVGKQAIHLGGATQIMFGIRGKRWDEQAEYEYVRRLFNDSWVYPDESEKPQNAKLVEGGCYW